MAKENYDAVNAEIFDHYCRGGSENTFLTAFCEVNNSILRTIANKLPIYAYRGAEAADAYSLVQEQVLLLARRMKREDEPYSRIWFNIIEWQAKEALHNEYDETGYTIRHTERLRAQKNSATIDPRIYSNAIEDVNEEVGEFDVNSSLKNEDIKRLVSNLIARALTEGYIKEKDIYIVTEMAINGAKQKDIAEHMGINVHTVHRRYHKALESLQVLVDKIDPQARELLYYN